MIKHAGEPCPATLLCPLIHGRLICTSKRCETQRHLKKYYSFQNLDFPEVQAHSHTSMLLLCKLHAKLNLFYECENQEDLLLGPVESNVLRMAKAWEQPNINCQAQGL